MNLEQAQTLVGEVVEITVKDEKYTGLLWFVGKNEFLNRLQANVGYSSPVILELDSCDQIRQVTTEELEVFDIKSFENIQKKLKKM